ncbi:alpha/beta hydrolase [Streptomyces sp. AcH 505]|uniref:alpha/beta fold hydrolase n=1 Tax=Streptomyces sp. AcH 505 TaxID=352211 RepID=UPI000591F515|nr:alpha/beta hydrolase [Streptomyces sp. AcH 505]
MNDERIVQVGGVDLCLQTFGDAADPALLLVAGAGSAMDWWEDAFCARLAAGRRFVVRYDFRDTGRSVSYPPGAPGYTWRDLVADAVGLLDELGVRRAHLVGVSMGGGLAQVVAVEHAERVASLTLISTSPAGPGGEGLPPVSDELAAALSRLAPPADWSDRAAVADFLVESQRALAGPASFDEPRVRALLDRVLDRTADIAASTLNHRLIDGGDPVRDRLPGITVPTLVLHGTVDPLFGYGHAEALAREIPGARLLPLPGVGHEMPPERTWDVVVPALLDHTAG